MTYVSSNPIYDIKDYILDALYADELLDETDYVTDFGQVQPMFPENQTPESNELFGSKPFIVYSTSQPRVIGTQYWLMEGEAVITVYSNDYDTATHIQTYLFDLLRRFEYTAMELNEFAQDNTFLTVYVTQSTDENEPNAEYGRYSASVSIEYQYTRPVSITGKFAF